MLRFILLLLIAVFLSICLVCVSSDIVEQNEISHSEIVLTFSNGSCLKYYEGIKKGCELNG